MKFCRKLRQKVSDGARAGTPDYWLSGIYLPPLCAVTHSSTSPASEQGLGAKWVCGQREWK